MTYFSSVLVVKPTTIPQFQFSYSTNTYTYATYTSSYYPPYNGGGNNYPDYYSPGLGVAAIVILVVIVLFFVCCYVGAGVIVFFMCRRSRKNTKKWYEPGGHLYGQRSDGLKNANATTTMAGAIPTTAAPVAPGTEMAQPTNVAYPAPIATPGPVYHQQPSPQPSSSSQWVSPPHNPENIAPGTATELSASDRNVSPLLETHSPDTTDVIQPVAPQASHSNIPPHV